MTVYNLAIDQGARQVNVSRFAGFLRRNIGRVLDRTKYGPQGEPLWHRVQGEIVAFLAKLWNADVLGGERSEEGYFVQFDRTTMAGEDVTNGRLIARCRVVLVGPSATFWLEINLRAGPRAEE